MDGELVIEDGAGVMASQVEVAACSHTLYQHRQLKRTAPETARGLPVLGDVDRRGLVSVSIYGQLQALSFQSVRHGGAQSARIALHTASSTTQSHSLRLHVS